MAQRRRGERVLGPYFVNGGMWRVILVAATGERINKEFESETEARQVIRSATRNMQSEQRTIEQAMSAYQKYMKDEKGNKARTLENNKWRVGLFFPDHEELLTSLTPLKGQQYYDRLRDRTIRVKNAEDVQLVSVDTHRSVLAPAKPLLRWV